MEDDRRWRTAHAKVGLPSRGEMESKQNPSSIVAAAAPLRARPTSPPFPAAMVSKTAGRKRGTRITSLILRQDLDVPGDRQESRGAEVRVERESVPHPILPHQRETGRIDITEGMVREARENFIRLPLKML